MSVAKTQLTGGNFQDAMGNLLANGYLTMKLSQDSQVNDSQVCSGVEIKIVLDGNGDVAAYPTIPADQFVWANDVLSPVNSFYTVTGYTAEGQPAFGPNNQQVVSGGIGGGTFDTGTWVPNQVVSWAPALQTPQVFVNGTALSSTQEIDFIDSATIDFVDEGNGEISANSLGVPPLTNGNFSTMQNFMGFEGATANLVDAISAGGGCSTVQVLLDTPITVSKISINVTTDTASSHGFAALYSADGTTKLIDAGHNAFDTSTTGIKTVTISPVTLPAGAYLIAWSSDAGSTDVRCAGVGSSALTYSYLQLLSANASRYVRATNGISSGNMPASLGVLTFPANSSDDFDIPAILFE